MPENQLFHICQMLNSWICAFCAVADDIINAQSCAGSNIEKPQFTFISPPGIQEAEEIGYSTVNPKHSEMIS